jgi:hypothetical protein
MNRRSFPISESITEDDEEPHNKRVISIVELPGSMRRLIVLTSLIILIGCAASWRMEYLKEGLGRVSQDDVALRMGPPLSTDALSTGEAVWLYQYTSADVHQTWCHEYVLKFDTQKILRDWTREEC